MQKVYFGHNFINSEKKIDCFLPLVYNLRNIFSEGIDIKILKQLGVIFLFGYTGEVVSGLLPFNFPSTVIGLLLMLLALKSGILKIWQIEETASFLIGNMAIFFVPSCVNVINSAEYIKPDAFKLIFICILSAFITFFATYLTVSFVRKLQEKRG